MATYIKTETGDIVEIESKREYTFKQVQHDGTITTAGDTSNLDKSVIRHRGVGVLQAKVS
jgi:hypothetical protein